MMCLSMIIGVVSAMVVLYLSFVFNVALSGTIVLVVTALFTLALLFSSRQGLVRRWTAVRQR